MSDAVSRAPRPSLIRADNPAGTRVDAVEGRAMSSGPGSPEKVHAPAPEVDAAHVRATQVRLCRPEDRSRWLETPGNAGASVRTSDFANPGQERPPASAWTAPAVVAAGAGAPPTTARAASTTPRSVMHPAASEPARPLGGVITQPLTTSQTSPVQGRWTGAPLVIHDNPESFSTPGVLGSTIGPVPGRGDGTADLPGQAHLFALANNRTGAPQRYSAVVHNASDQPLVLDVSGTMYSKDWTKTDGRTPSSYQADGGFRGPQAIAARSYLAAEPGQNGYLEKTVTIGPHETKTVASTGMHPGGEVFTMLDLKARTPGQPFRVASVASPGDPSAQDLARLRSGAYPAAGTPRDFAPAGGHKLGRPNGVVEAGSVFEGGRTITLEPGTRTADLFYATRFKNAGNTDEIGALTHTLANPTGVGPAAQTNDGAYGAVHRLRYTLDNPGEVPRRVEVSLTAPSAGEGRHRPTGGELTLPVKVNGQLRESRVDGRGEGRVIEVVEVPPRSQRRVELELAHFGNTFPPAGVELRVR